MRRLVNALLALTVLVLAGPGGDAIAQRNQLRPADFEPLTELPWEAPNTTLDSVLDRIFREPNPSIRYPLLAEYLRMVPAEQLSHAFDRSISLEGNSDSERSRRVPSRDLGQPRSAGVLGTDEAVVPRCWHRGGLALSRSLEYLPSDQSSGLSGDPAFAVLAQTRIAHQFPLGSECLLHS